MSPGARQVIMMASHSAAAAGADETGPEFFLLALLTGPRTSARDYLRERGLTVAIVQSAIEDTNADDIVFDDADAAALAALGFDLPSVLRQLEERFGPTDPGARPHRRPGPRRRSAGFGRAGADVISEALLEARMDSAQMSPEHLLLGLLRAPSPTCADLLAAYDMSYEDARERLLPPRRDAS
jgi:ATP-dependent Clp protease ATP-binding subunit ClpA